MAEYFDWVDRTDRIIGVAAREEAHRLKLYHRAVHLYARGSSGGLLLQKRSSSKDMEPGLWTLSCSGHVDRGETYLFAAIREMVEELNVSIEPVPNPEEIAELKEIGLEELDSWMIREPQVFSSSFRHLFPMARKRFLKIR
jgi:8-oxo-dGTP pyrophosphatase MutT (NUDIX family)